MELLKIVIWVCFGATCALIAHQRGRSPVGWFFIGMLTTCVGLILVIVLPDLKKQQAEFDKLRAQNQMLKERLAKDRMVADQRHLEAEGRLRAHDRMLGIDTAPGPESRAQLEPAIPPLPLDGTENELHSRLWYYAIDSKEHGPLEVASLRSFWQAGDVGPDTLVWAKGMQQWTPIREVPGLSEVLRA